MTRIANSLPTLPTKGSGARQLRKRQPHDVASVKSLTGTNAVQPSELRSVRDIGQSQPNEARGTAGRARGTGHVSLETKLLKALLPAGTAAQLLHAGNVSRSLADLKEDWSKLLDDRNDPLLQVAELALEHSELDFRDMQRRLHVLIAP